MNSESRLAPLLSGQIAKILSGPPAVGPRSDRYRVKSTLCRRRLGANLAPTRKTPECWGVFDEPRGRANDERRDARCDDDASLDAKQQHSCILIIQTIA